MSEARLPLAYRDSCAGLLIPLNRCRVDTCYLPWKCVVWLNHPLPPSLRPPFLPLSHTSNQNFVFFGFFFCSYTHHHHHALTKVWFLYLFSSPPPQDERHSYEKCQYEEFKKRVAKMDELRASKGGARSNWYSFFFSFFFSFYINRAEERICFKKKEERKKKKKKKKVYYESFWVYNTE